MVEMGLSSQLGEKIMKACEEAKNFHKENSFIATVQSRYNWLESRLQFFQKHMLQKELKEVKDVVENPRISKRLGKGAYEWRDIE